MCWSCSWCSWCVVGCSEAAALSRPCTEAPRRPARRGGGSRAAPAAARRAASASSAASRHWHRLCNYLTLCLRSLADMTGYLSTPGRTGRLCFLISQLLQTSKFLMRVLVSPGYLSPRSVNSVWLEQGLSRTKSVRMQIVSECNVSSVDLWLQSRALVTTCDCYIVTWHQTVAALPLTVKSGIWMSILSLYRDLIRVCN